MVYISLVRASPTNYPEEFKFYLTMTMMDSQAPNIQRNPCPKSDTALLTEQIKARGSPIRVYGANAMGVGLMSLLALIQARGEFSEVIPVCIEEGGTARK